MFPLQWAIMHDEVWYTKIKNVLMLLIIYSKTMTFFTKYSLIPAFRCQLACVPLSHKISCYNTAENHCCPLCSLILIQQTQCSTVSRCVLWNSMPAKQNQRIDSSVGVWTAVFCCESSAQYLTCWLYTLPVQRGISFVHPYSICTLQTEWKVHISSTLNSCVKKLYSIAWIKLENPPHHI